MAVRSLKSWKWSFSWMVWLDSSWKLINSSWKSTVRYKVFRWARVWLYFVRQRVFRVALERPATIVCRRGAREPNPHQSAPTLENSSLQHINCIPPKYGIISKQIILKFIFKSIEKLYLPRDFKQRAFEEQQNDRSTGNYQIILRLTF